MNHETAKEAADLLQQAKRQNDRAVGGNIVLVQKAMSLVIKVLIIVLGELTIVGCSGGIFRSFNESDAGESWSSDASHSDPTTSTTITSDAAVGGGTTLTDVDIGGRTGNSSVGGGGNGSFLASSSSGGSLAATGGSTSDATGGASTATGGASQYHDPGECPCPQNNACQVSASGCNVPGTKGNEGNETFTCVTSPLRCATGARPVFCFQC